MKKLTVSILGSIILCSLLSCTKNRENTVFQITKEIREEIWRDHPVMNVSEWIPHFLDTLANKTFCNYTERGDTLEFYSASSGKYFLNFENGNQRITGEYEDGVPNGVFKRYWSDGTGRDYVEFKNGVLHGKHVILYSDGFFNVWAHYPNGLVDYLKVYKKVGEDMELVDIRISQVRKGDLIEPGKRFRTGEDINVEFGQVTTSLKNPLYKFHIILDKTDTLIVRESVNRMETFNFNIKTEGQHYLGFLIEEYDLLTKIKLGESYNHYDLLIEK